ncbi:MAG: protoglobin domain-containing protein, partial [Myxococcales bacterium]|nr:protoglobin domain-containing protein [Myxococcales bacterium]
MADPSLLVLLKGYVGFDAEASHRLQRMGSSMRPYHRVIVDRFYQAILRDPGARAVLEGEAQVERLKVSLTQWVEGLFSGPYDETYFEKRARIGRVHVKVGLEQRYMLAAMNVVREGLHRALWAAS